MVTPELLKYVQDQKTLGVTDDQLRQVLSAQGWFGDDINAALNPQAVPQMGAAQSLTEPTIAAGKTSLPLEARGWSWGAFGLTWIWGIRFKVWLAFLTFVPMLNLIWVFVLGGKGRKWAWENQGTANPEELQDSLKRWDKWGFIIFITSFVATGLIYFFMFQSLKDLYLNNNNSALPL